MWHETVRVFAVVFLVLACADLAFPQICGEDSAQLLAGVATTGDADSGQPPVPTEDCFCCCSHILSTESGAFLSALAMVSGADLIPPPGVPLPPAELLFHPPRLA